MKNRNLNGFSMVELLVALAVVAVLAAFLLPATHKAIEKGRQVRCTGNMRVIGGMIGTWAMDNNGQIPACSSTSITWPFMLAARVMNQTLKPGGSRYDVFYCPTLSAIGHNGNSGPTSGYWTNYTANAQVMGVGSAAYPIRRLVEFSKPSRTGVMWDACASPNGPSNRSVLVTAPYHVRAGDLNQAVGWVHGSTVPQLRRYGLANVLFLDGHVEGVLDPGDGNYLPIARQGLQLWE